jgi:predicted Ser/Thr protein kinase
VDRPELIERLSVNEQAELWLARLPGVDSGLWVIRLAAERGRRLPEAPSSGILSGVPGLGDLQVAVCDVDRESGRLDVSVQALDSQGHATLLPEPGDELSARQILNALVQALSNPAREHRGGETRVQGAGGTTDDKTRIQPGAEASEETVMAPPGLHDQSVPDDSISEQEQTRAFDARDPSDEFDRDDDNSLRADKTAVLRPDDATVIAPSGAESHRGTERIDDAIDATEQFESTEWADDPPRHAVGDTPVGQQSHKSGGGFGLSVGSVLRNRFRITGVLGEGGMGAVFSAVDMLKEEARDENVNVALKVMKADIVDEHMSFMGLQREARRAQQLAHPNIVTVYDFDRAGGVIYMTMEFLRGQPLDELLKRNPHGLDLDSARDITAQISNGLAYAHNEGIVHADLKPQNVFVLDSGRAKILDFGIARAYQAKKVDVVESVFSGYSPAFASPEVMARKNPSPADDIYALGCVVYMLFTGRHPFDWTSAEKAAEQGLKPKRESSFKRAEWSAVARALSFDGSKRPKDAAEFLKHFAPSRVRQAAMGVSLASVLAAGIFVWWYEPVPGPDTPFEELPVEVQQQISRNLDDAALFLTYGDLDNTFQLYDAVLVAHPRNPDAMEGMQKASQEAIRMIRARVEQGEISEATGRQALDALLDYESLPSRIRRQLRDARDSL